jgi:beta-lactamase class A
MKMLFLAAATTAALLQTQVATIASKADGVVGVTAIDLDTGRRVSINGDQRFPLASVVKLPVAIAYLQRVDRGEDSLTRDVTLTPADFRPGVSPIADDANGKPITVTMGRILNEMVSNSDNTAVDYMLRTSVPPSQVMSVLKTLGVSGIDVSRQEGAVIAFLSGDESGNAMTRDKYVQSQNDAAMAKFAKDPRDTSTPDGMADLLSKLYSHKVGLSPESEEILLRAMRETETGPHRLRGNLPEDVTIAHKTGTMPGTLNDVGIITSPDGKHHIAIAAFTKGAQRNQESRQEAAIAGIAKAIYDAWVQ